MGEPTKTRIVSGDPEARTGSVKRPATLEGLSDSDVERIAQRVAEILREVPAEQVADDDYIAVRRNAERRPMSGY